MKSRFVLILAFCTFLIPCIYARGRCATEGYRDKKVIYVEYWERPMSWTYGFVSHVGIIATTPDGTECLIHKGYNYGPKTTYKAWETIATEPSYMSSEWKKIKERRVQGNFVIKNYIRLGGRHYDLFCDNCIDAANRMFDFDDDAVEGPITPTINNDLVDRQNDVLSRLTVHGKQSNGADNAKMLSYFEYQIAENPENQN